MKLRLGQLVGYGSILLAMCFTLGCGDGKTCDCCKEKKDCEFGLKCVDLIGGSGKVCGSAGINYCSADACASSSSGLYDSRPMVSTPETDGTYAVVDAFKDLVEDDDDTETSSRD